VAVRPFPFSYAKNADSRGWGSGWPNCGGASGNLATVYAGNSGVAFTVHKRIARLVDILIDYCANHGYDFVKGQCGAYNCRAIGGTKKPSNHSWALALDINWQLNPMRKPKTTNIPGWMVDVFETYGFAWGGSYSGTPDTMHFEFMGTPAQADEMTNKAIRELLNGNAPATPAQPNTQGSSVIGPGSKGPAVGRWQEYCNKMYTRFKPPLVKDDDFGERTRLRTIEIQRFLGIQADGKVGPQTKTRTGFKG